jgi:hypothetical protein
MVMAKAGMLREEAIRWARCDTVAAWHTTSPAARSATRSLGLQKGGTQNQNRQNQQSRPSHNAYDDAVARKWQGYWGARLLNYARSRRASQ